ncbi:MAG TPA: His/Gly/Thr/Pro-type tRNA ligase C-terminal domain-containing protein, partial [Nitrososphaerales archaeon]|nr:His/Gly/Thr/Pro-type tRNA ligase C-terminal domain-containing protein [Nitrososphaerales archaeon]
GDLHGQPEDVLRKASEMGLTGTEDLGRLFDLLRSRGVGNLEYNLRIVRGIDYYTGIVFEVADAANPRLGSLCGGGRYDALPKMLGRPDLAATGAAGGVEREAMSIAKESVRTGIVAFVACASPEVFADASRLLAHLRETGIPADASPPGRSLGKQLEDASSLGARWALVLGKREVASGSVTLRDMDSGKEEMVTPAEAVRRIGSS